MRRERREWPLREHRLDIAWGVFAFLNLFAMVLVPEWETVPFHFIWVSLTIVYGIRVWRLRQTSWVLAVVVVVTGVAIGVDVVRSAQPLDEITEVPLMAAMFAAMVWHAQRRLTSMRQVERVSAENLRLLERERRFVQDASHELRTPITVALGHAQLIQRTTDDPTIAEDASVIADELLRLRRLADRLLLLAGLDHPDFFSRAPLDVEALAVDAFHRWAATPRHWVLGETVEARIEGDAERLLVALDCLIENAVKHTTTDDTIEIAVRRLGRSVVVAVADSGSGIPPEDLQKIFDRFARAHPRRGREDGGFGLGLSIVKAIVEAHGGEVQARSAAGEGSVFEMILPPAGETTTGEIRPTDEAGQRPTGSLRG